MSLRHAMSVLALLAVLFCSHTASARDREGDPLAYDLHVALFPVAFQAGVSQGAFGSAMRAEYQLVRPLDVAVFARGSWWNVTGERSTRGLTIGGTLSIHPRSRAPARAAARATSTCRPARACRDPRSRLIDRAT
jgi:hypothetical protein